MIGNRVAIGDPQFAFGAINGEVMCGIVFDPHPLNPSDFLMIEWQAYKHVATLPGPPPARPCDELPPLFCIGSAEYCSELAPFAPAVSAGYLNYPVKDETWDDQHRSFLRRDLIQAVQYAAKVAYRTADWDYGNFGPLGLGDMSDANSDGPTTNSLPDHLGHEDGNHIDVAYYQLYAPDNLLRPVGRHEDGYLTERPYALDSWRTALFLVDLCEHPHMRYIAVDAQVGLRL